MSCLEFLLFFRRQDFKEEVRLGCPIEAVPENGGASGLQQRRSGVFLSGEQVAREAMQVVEPSGDLENSELAGIARTKVGERTFDLFENAYVSPF